MFVDFEICTMYLKNEISNSMVDNAASQEAPPQQEIKDDPNLAADTSSSIPVYKENDVSKQEHIASKIKEQANNGKYLIFWSNLYPQSLYVSIVLFYIWLINYCYL